MKLYQIADPLPISCPECGHDFVFFDGDHQPDSYIEPGAYWGACDACCMIVTKVCTTQRELIESLDL